MPCRFYGLDFFTLDDEGLVHRSLHLDTTQPKPDQFDWVLKSGAALE